jgi:hypothetical protein
LGEGMGESIVVDGKAELLGLFVSLKISCNFFFFFQEILLDLFTYPHGPRVRDKLSHGEADIFVFPKSICTAIFTVVIYFTAKYQSTTILKEKV